MVTEKVHMELNDMNSSTISPEIEGTTITLQ